MKKRILVAILLIGLLLGVAAVASAADLETTNKEVTWYTGLSTEYIENGVYSRSTTGQMWFPEDKRDYTDLSIQWVLVHVNGPDNFVLSYEPRDSWEESYFYAEAKPKSSTLTPGTSVYTMKATYKNVVYTGTLTIHTENLSQPPTGMKLKYAEFNPGTGVIGAYTTVSNNGEVLIQEGKTYVFTGIFDGAAPGSADDHWLNYWTSDGLTMLERWDYTDSQGNKIFHSYDGVVRGYTPGTYEYGATMSVGNSNLEAAMNMTLKVADQNGIVPKLKPVLSGNYDWLSMDADNIDYTIYLGLGFSSNESVWNRGEFINFNIYNYEQMKKEYGGEPTWNVTPKTISGETLDYRTNSRTNGIWSMFQSMPATASESEFTVTCTWGGETATKKVKVHVVQPTFTLPTGVSIPGVDSNGVYNTQEGKTITIEPAVLPAGYSGVPGYNAQYWSAGGLWDFANQVWPNQSEIARKYNIMSGSAGTYTDTIGVSYGALMVTQRVTFRVADSNGYVPDPVLPLSIQAKYSQNHPQAGQKIDLNWSVTGGTAPYSVQIEWQAMEGCLRKTMQSTVFTTSSGTDSFTPPSVSIDQVQAKITVTDSNNNTETQWCYAQLEGWDHGYNKAAYYSVYNDMDYVQVGQEISGSWNITPGQYTISNVRYRWITWYKDSQGRTWELMTDWTNVGNTLTGNTAKYTTTKAGKAYLDVAFDANDGWTNPGGRFEPIQVLSPGEAPLVAEITINPQEAKTDEDITIAWNVTGASANTDIDVKWWFYPYGNSSSSSESLGPASATGTKKLNFSESGSLQAEIRVKDRMKDLEFTRRVYATVKEPAGFNISVSPANPQLGQEVTISWEITRQSYDSAGLSVELYAGYLKKNAVIPHVDFMTNKTGSIKFTPTEGDSFKVRGRIGTNTGSFSVESEKIPLTGTWNAPAPINVNVTYTVQQTRSVSGPHIIADYSITGGTGNISYIDATWIRKEADGRTVYLQARNLSNTAAGQLAFTPTTDGNYALVFDVTDYDSGWNFRQDPSMVTDMVAVTGTSQTALGIDVFAGLPEMIEPDGSYQLCWDVTGGDSSSNRQTHVYMTTNDGIVLNDYTSWGYTNYGGIPANKIGANSQSVIIELTPKDNTSTGTTFRTVIPIHRTTPAVYYYYRESTEEVLDSLSVLTGESLEFNVICEGADRIYGTVKQHGTSTVVNSFYKDGEDVWIDLAGLGLGTYDISIWGSFNGRNGSVKEFSLTIQQPGTISYSFSDGTLTISGSGPMPNYGFSTESQEDYSGAEWNVCRNTATRIVISDGVTTIGSCAFAGFDHVTSVSLPDGMTNIGDHAFYRCKALQGIVIPNTVTGIGTEAFYGCESLAQVSLPSALVSIGNSAFQDCTGLTGVVLPEGVEVIGRQAFCFCEALGNITLPSSLKKIGAAAFASCKISNITVSGSSKTWSFFYALGDGDHLYHIALPASVTEVGEGAFYDNRLAYDAPDFITPSSLTTIEEEAFYGTQARFVWLTGNVEKIGARAFADSEVQYVFIPYSCNDIAANAFPKDTVILGFEGTYDYPSYAEAYATANGYKFISLENPFGGNG
ncbi:MAG: leucine-rich repeat domain-containing protein [Clostridia bacterium]|nr:leucine-rich repeat domain-containing protein [Clostridia bacterium]